MSDPIRILIAGDICSAKSTQLNTSHDHQHAPFSNIERFFKEAAYVVANLECPLTDHPLPIPKTGPCIWGSPLFSNSLYQSGIHAVGLANNHIKDAGEQAVLETIQSCRDVGVTTFGAGRNHAEAACPNIVEIQGVRVCFLAMAEHEFCLAGRDRPGANPLSAKGFVRFTRQYRAHYDILVVLYHGGMEQYAYPTPEQQDLCRFMVEEGASLVVCQHSHCIGCTEEYLNGHIVYGQGNFFFPYDLPRPKTWYEGLLIELSIEQDTKKCKTQFIPFEQCKNGEQVNIMPDAEAQDVMALFQERSQQVQDTNWVREQWEIECRRSGKNLFHGLRGTGRILRRLYRFFPFLDSMSKSRRRLCSLNLIRCQTHRERIKTYLEID